MVLYLFTNHFPYSHQENFLEDEIHHLSKVFNKIVVVSFDKEKKIRRALPDNCEVVDIYFNTSRLKYIFHGLFHPRSTPALIKEFFCNQVYLSKKRLLAWGSSKRYINNCLYNKELMTLLNSMKKEDIAYFYWGIGQCLLSIFLKNKVHLISRFHGAWDLWEESYGNFHSLRTEVSQCLDKAIFISKKGESYFKNRYPNCPTAVYPLGSKDFGVQPPNPKDGIVRIVSCSTVYPLKRVPLIFDALNKMEDLNIEWTHLGGGTHFEQLIEKVVKERRRHLKVNLIGMMTHDSIMEYYSRHHFDIFINLSTSEGVPVSIMEAMSFDIPIIATDVGSTSEEVPPIVGQLLPAEPSYDNISDAIRKMLVSSYSPRSFWNDHYNAEKNYREFAEMLTRL